MLQDVKKRENAEKNPKKLPKETRDTFLGTGRKMSLRKKGVCGAPRGQVKGCNWWCGIPDSAVDFFVA